MTTTTFATDARLSTTARSKLERVRAEATAFWGDPARMEAGIAQVLEPIEAQHARRDARLRALLRRAKERSPWHARRLAHIDVDAVSGDDLTAIPTMTKRDLMENWDDIVTDRGVTLAAASAHLDRLRRGEWDLLNDRYAVLASGGTTGRRGVFLLDFARTSMVPDWKGGMDRYWAWQGRASGSGDGGSLTRARVMSTAPYHVSAVWRWIYPGNNDHLLSAAMPVAELVDALNELRPSVLATYPSIGYRLALEVAAGRLEARPNVVTTSGERLLPEARAAMEASFGSRVVEEYGATEAYMTTWNVVHPGMHFVEDDGVYEPVDAAGSPVSPGVASDRMLITNLYSYALPLIRYELTDQVVLDPGPNPGPLAGRRVLAVGGRQEDWFHYAGGVDVHPVTFHAVLDAHDGLAEYQVRQTARGAEVDVVTVSAVDTDSLGAELSSALAAAGLDGAHVAIRPVAALTRHAETAKLRRFVPLPR